MLVAGAQEVARPSSSSRPPRRCAAAQAARSASGHCATGRQRRMVPSATSVMPGLHAAATGPDAKDRSRVMSGSAGALGSGIEGNRRLFTLVAKELPYQLVLAGVQVEINLGG